MPALAGHLKSVRKFSNQDILMQDLKKSTVMQNLGIIEF